MALEIHARPEHLMSDDQIGVWREIPTTIIGDELNRTNVMQAAIKPVAAGMSFAGQALTVQLMVGDNSAGHYALAELWQGAIMVLDGRAHTDTAVWGEIMHQSAKARGAAGVVVDGSLRDLAAIRESGLPAFCRGAVPLGPHKGWGGAVNGPIQCGGVPVAPGDLMVGDDDGIVVVRPEQLEGLYDRCQARLQKEVQILARVSKGEKTIDVLGMPPPEKVGS